MEAAVPKRRRRLLQDEGEHSPTSPPTWPASQLSPAQPEAFLGAPWPRLQRPRIRPFDSIDSDRSISIIRFRPFAAIPTTPPAPSSFRSQTLALRAMCPAHNCRYREPCGTSVRSAP